MGVFLSKHGIGIPECPLAAGDPDRKIPVRVLTNERPTFSTLIIKFIHRTNDPAKHVGPQFDRVIAALRLHVLSLTGRFYDWLAPLATPASSMLDGYDFSDRDT
jgi:hypothetical protein